MAALATMCRSIESSHDRDVILEPLSILKNVLPVQPAPVLLPSDSTSSPLKSTRLAGQLISCFVVGGECRLCLPQFLAMVLPNVNDAIIQKVNSDLQIHTAIATPTQMKSLKISGILPPGASTCSLIRKSDAERLVSRLLPQSSGRLQNPKLREEGVAVRHDGFGGCSGLLIPSLIVDECSAAIECSECNYLFTGETFVSHTHGTSEPSQVCHWGFDTANWRYYIYLADEDHSTEDDRQKLQLCKNFKEIEAQKKISAILNSQIRALKRRNDTKVHISISLK
ncbi:unnamed protein product [Enterobius vermicularis]|uniref:C-SKI_SMAD_bind domain-containing protein n=1 Tax=Enterobius vermicularis TaxID=51028 RepID=A0A0N4V156_ENTVE|nr:unnamed protein product [Enterobius vermicularis]